MSMGQIEAFYKKVMKDDALKEKVMTIKGVPESVGNAVLEIAKQEGFDVTIDDFKKLYLENVEVSDEELAQVVGGVEQEGQGLGCSPMNESCHTVCDEMCGSFLGHYIGKQR